MVSHDDKYGPRESCPHCQRARHSPAEYLWALDRAATPGPWTFGFDDMDQAWYVQHEYLKATKEYGGASELIPSKEEDGKAIVALRNLLPLLADVVEAAQEAVRYWDTWPHNVPGRHLDLLRESLRPLTAAVAEVEGKA